MFIDSHTHLNSPTLFENRKKHILDFEKIWWQALVNIWADEEYNKNGITISKEYSWDSFIKCTVWLHPYEVVVGNINENNIEQKLNELEKLYLENKDHIVAIWEAGIDTHYEWDKKLKICFHCRWYGSEEIEKLKNYNLENYWIWFCGNVTYPKAQNIRDSLKICNLENILIETDAPYLSPQELRWQTNYPQNIQYIYDFIAKELNIDTKNLKKQIKKNFYSLYKK